MRVGLQKQAITRRTVSCTEVGMCLHLHICYCNLNMYKPPLSEKHKEKATQ